MMIDFVELSVLIIVLNYLNSRLQGWKKNYANYLSFFPLIWIEVDVLWRIIDLMNLTLIVSHPISIQIRELN